MQNITFLLRPQRTFKLQEMLTALENLFIILVFGGIF